jgi:hypothetical protein
MDDFFASGRVVDLILLLMAAEAALLVFLHARGHLGIPPLRLLPNLLAGACLLMALRAALTGAGLVQCSVWLLLGLGGHLLDLATRWRGLRRG